MPEDGAIGAPDPGDFGPVTSERTVPVRSPAPLPLRISVAPHPRRRPVARAGPFQQTGSGRASPPGRRCAAFTETGPSPNLTRHPIVYGEPS